MRTHILLMNITMFTPADLLHNWQQQQLCSADFSVTRKVGRVHYMGWFHSCTASCYCYLVCGRNDTPSMNDAEAIIYKNLSPQCTTVSCNQFGQLHLYQTSPISQVSNLNFKRRQMLQLSINLPSLTFTS